MRFTNIEDTNDEFTKTYPQLDKCFDENNVLCSTYMCRVSNILCQYVSAGRNVLENMHGVGEQNLHVDYNPNPDEPKTKNI